MLNIMDKNYADNFIEPLFKRALKNNDYLYNLVNANSDVMGMYSQMGISYAEYNHHHYHYYGEENRLLEVTTTTLLYMKMCYRAYCRDDWKAWYANMIDLAGMVSDNNIKIKLIKLKRRQYDN